MLLGCRSSHGFQTHPGAEGHRRGTGAGAAALRSLCSSPALVLWDRFGFRLRTDALPYSTQLPGGADLTFPSSQLSLNDLALILENNY